jgi:hypothetical protein
MKNLLYIIFIIAWNGIHAQYPFEVFPRIEYTKYKIRHSFKIEDSTFVGEVNIVSKRKNETIRLELNEKLDKDSANLYVYKNSELIQRIIEPMGFFAIVVPDSLFVCDINNDGIIDVKITCYNPGCGLAAYYLRKIYLIGKPNGLFLKFSFMDFSYEIERDFNGDKNFEIIGIDHTGYQNHSYWVYDLYNIKDGHFINVSKENGYPIMIQHLYRLNYAITDKISRVNMIEFSRSRPDWYDERR